MNPIAFSVELRRTHGQYRRYEESKNRRSREEETIRLAPGAPAGQRQASAAAGLAAGMQASKNRKYKQLMIECCLNLRFLNGLTREARAAGADCCFDSSDLRIFALDRGLVSA